MNNHFLAEVFAITKKKGGGGGGASVLQSGANLVDYDGSLVQHYTKEEFLALTEMPSNPSHTGLVAQGWNWSLADAKAYITKYGSLNIGQMYTTDTGDTRIYIHIDKDTPQNRLTFYVRFTSSVANNVVIDWGDGTVETKGSTIATNYPHEYTTGGDYVIKLKVNTGTISFDGQDTSTTSGQSIYGDRSNVYYYNRTRITHIEIGNDVTNLGLSVLNGCNTIVSITIPNSVTNIGDYAFHYCRLLKSITIPNTVTNIGSHAFYACAGLSSIAIPNSVTSIGNYTLGNCYALKILTLPDSIIIIEASLVTTCTNINTITIPNSVVNIGDYSFYACNAIVLITISDNVTSIGANAFNNCYSVSEYHLLTTTPPTLANINAFSNIPSDCKIYVPYSADHSILAAYQSATNWSTYASYMVEEPQP